MTTKTTTFSLLCALSFSVSAGCDLETEDSMELISDADDGDALSPLSSEAENTLTAPADAAASITFAETYEGLGKLDTLADGDVVMIKNYKQGYLGCFGGVPQFAHGPNNIDNYVWQVHEVDIGADGLVEFQFELVDDTGATGTYLKMGDAGDVFCDAINGIGDAAAWHEDSQQRTGGGTDYRKFHVQLKNYKQSLCLQGKSSTEALSKTCGSSLWNMGFWVEVIA